MKHAVTAAAAALGALAALGQAPWGLWPLAHGALAGVFALVALAPTARRALLLGWVAGTAQFALALSWLVEPFLVDAATTGWMAPFALALMAGGLALFWALPGWLAWRLGAGPLSRLWLFVPGLLGFEDLRGWLFTGFPWALSGHVWIGTPVDQLAALGGAPLLSALTLGVAGLLAQAALALRGRRWPTVLGLGLLALALPGLAWHWGAARLAGPRPADTQIMVRLVQGNVPQADKWRAGMVEGFFLRHLDLSAAPAARAPDLVIWSETAAPFFLDNPGDGLVMAAEAAGAPLVMGLQRRHDGADGIRRYFNSLAVIAPDGSVQGVYDKHHLVPFGEYIPFVGDWAQAQGWGGLAARVLSGYSPGPGPALLDLGHAGMALPLICYEAVFPRNLRGAARPDWILQSTNDAWFGTRTGPFQHLAQARLRAIETGLPLARAANTGVSAMIDPFGRETARLGLGETGIVDALIPGALEPTLYARTGDLPGRLALLVALIGLLAHSWVRRRKPLTLP